MSFSLWVFVVAAATTGVGAQSPTTVLDALLSNSECANKLENGAWVPVDSLDQACGESGPVCTYPDSWCSASGPADAAIPTFACTPLTPECKAKLPPKDSSSTTTGSTPSSTASSTSEGASTTTSGGSTGTSTTSAASSSTEASTTTAATSTTGGSTSSSGPTPAPGPSSVAPAGGSSNASKGCQDYVEFCCFWASAGECDKNPVFMRTICQKSCGTCGCTAETAPTCPVKVNTDGCKYLTGSTGSGGNSTTRAPTSAGTTASSSNATGAAGSGFQGQSREGCQDSDGRCAQWAAQGECERNPYWMKPNCRQSCGCQAQVSNAGASQNPNCRDWNDLCGFWASREQCSQNAPYMTVMCKSSCRLC